MAESRHTGTVHEYQIHIAGDYRQRFDAHDRGGRPGGLAFSQ